MPRAITLLAAALAAVTVFPVATTSRVASAGELPEPPPSGSTFRGSDPPRVAIDLAVTAPDRRGGVQVRVTVALTCGPRRAGLEDTVRGRIRPDGRLRIDAVVSGPAEGFQTSGRVRIDGTFSDAGATTEVRFSLRELDSDDELVDECDAGPVDVALEVGPTDPGLALVEAAIPTGAADARHRHATTAASATHLFVALRTSPFDLGEHTTLLLRIDPLTNEVELRREIDDEVWGLVIVGDQLFGIDTPRGSVVAIDPDTLRSGRRTKVTRGTETRDLSYDDAPLWPGALEIDGDLWLAASSERALLRFDPERREVVDRVDLDRYPSVMAVGPDGLYVVTVDDDGVVVRVDPSRSEVVATSEMFVTLDTVVANATEVVIRDAAPSPESGLRRLDPVTLATVASAADDQPFPLLAAPPGVWALSNPDDVLLALGDDLAVVTEVLSVDVGDRDFVGPTEAFGAVWLYDEELRTVYRIATF